jgi:hypothetical protein
MVGITEYIGIAKTRPDPFMFLILPIGWKRKILVLDRRVFFKRPLRVQQNQAEHRCQRPGKRAAEVD